jgi:hypothetical protein
MFSSRHGTCNAYMQPSACTNLQDVKHADGYLPTHMAAVRLIIIVESRSFSPCHPAVSISIGLSVLYG